MKVIHLIGGGDVGGAKVHVLSLIKELTKHIDVKLISLRPGQFADEALEMGIDVEVVRTGNIILDIKKIRSIIDNGKYELLHSHGAKANMISLLVKKFSNLPTVTTVHSDYKLDYMHSFAKRITFGSINSIALRKIDYHIGVSNNFRQMLIDRNFNINDIFTLYNGMDFNKPLKNYNRNEFIQKYKLNISSDDIIVGIAARLYPVKGLETLIRAAHIAAQKKSDIKFIIGGDGEDRQHLENLTSELGISNTVFFLGWMNDPYELMSNVDISVLTSISESFPYSVLEGARFKKATISSKVGGIPDLIENGFNGYLFEPGDYEKLAEHIINLSEDPEKRRIMGERIHQKASTQFSLENMCKTQLDIYEKIFEKEKLKKEPYDVIISGYYGFKNVGDEAMLKAIIDNLRSLKKNIKIIVLSKNPVETSTNLNVDSIGRMNLWQIFRTMKNAKLFIYGGGNLIQDNTSSRSLMYYLGTIWIAKKMKLKVMFYAHGLGPLNKNNNIRITRWIIDKVDLITLREHLSLLELERININKPKVEITADAALSYNYSLNIPSRRIFIDEGIISEGPFIGFSVRYCPGLDEKKNDEFFKVLAQTADYVSNKYNLVPLFIPMQYPVDVPSCEKVMSMMNTKAFCIRSKHTVDETLSVISQLEMLIGMRLHALIFAASMGIPIIGIEYDPKIKGFLQYIEQPSAGTVTSVNDIKLNYLVDNVWKNKDKIKEVLMRDISKLKDKAFENAKMAIDLIEKENPTKISKKNNSNKIKPKGEKT